MKKIGIYLALFLGLLIVSSPFLLIYWGRGMLHDADVHQREELIPSTAKQKVLERV